MNQKVLIPILLFCMIALQCKKQDDPYAKYYYGSASIIKNGENFHYSLANCLHNSNSINDTVSIQLERAKGYYVYESLLFIDVLKKTGRQKIYKLNHAAGAKSPEAFFIIRSSGHEIADLYDLYEKDSLTNFIDITSIDSNKEIKGKFNATFIYESINAPHKLYASSPDTVRISGTFHTKILD